MQAADGYTDIPAGKLANVVTCVEMRSRVPLRPERDVPGVRIERFSEPDLARFRALIRHVGEPYLWQSPLLMTQEQFDALSRDARAELYVVRRDGKDEGVLDLDFHVAGECEIRLFGVSEALLGTGAGRKLMNFALNAAWSHEVERVWLHTCTFDHPEALPFYIRSGFVPFKRQIEIYDDPRLTGLYPPTAAPNIPVL